MDNIGVVLGVLAALIIVGAASTAAAAICKMKPLYAIAPIVFAAATYIMYMYGGGPEALAQSHGINRVLLIFLFPFFFVCINVANIALALRTARTWREDSA